VVLRLMINSTSFLCRGRLTPVRASRGLHCYEAFELDQIASGHQRVARSAGHVTLGG
jgi:hypothetical protein